MKLTGGLFNITIMVYKESAGNNKESVYFKLKNYTGKICHNELGAQSRSLHIVPKVPIVFKKPFNNDSAS